MKLRTPLIIGLATATAGVTAVAIAGTATAEQNKPSPPVAPSTLAASTASTLVASRPAYLHASTDDRFVQRAIISSAGYQYVPYVRTHKGLPVVGGDFVVVVDRSGRTSWTSVAQTRAIGDLPTTPRISQDDALATAKRKLRKVKSVERTELVVVTTTGAPALAWESTINGTGADRVSRLTVDVDATTGKVLRTQEHVTEGSGTGWINGDVDLKTSQEGGSFSLSDPDTKNLSCQDSRTETVFSGPDDTWGDGVPTDVETGCVDALYVAQQQKAMLADWLGRDGQDGQGGAWPIRVGLPDLNAFYDGQQVQIGRNQAGQWLTSADVVGHELGHGIDDTTPGGISGEGTQEFVADTLGTATEFFANNPGDKPDYEIGEEVDLVGQGPIRFMYDPSKIGDSNCFSAATPDDEVHAAAGPGNHWFYMLSEGTNPTNGQPPSKPCNDATITGVGIENAMKIMYNAMLVKTSASSYPNYRIWTLQAAKTLFPGSCTEFDTVKAAWDAVNLPAQPGEATCTQ